MTVTIRKLAGTEHEYFAYAASLGGRGTYFVYFEDTIWGAMVLHKFLEMLRIVLAPQTPITLTLSEPELVLKHRAVLDILRTHSSSQETQNTVESEIIREQPAE